MFSSTAPILRRMGRRLNDVFTSPCLDENLKYSVNCCIVCLLIIHSTTMTEQDKITIFDTELKLFLCADFTYELCKFASINRPDYINHVF